MALISYTSFPPVDNDPESQNLISLEQLQLADNSTFVDDDMKPVEIEDEGVEEDEITSDGCHHHLVAPVTPTKERSRRATMPEITKPRPQDVSPLPLSSRQPLHVETHFPCFIPFAILLLSAEHDLNIDCS